MLNEFHNLELLCVPPQLVPPYGGPENQGCTLPGAVPGSATVSGEAYLKAQLGYSYSHLWRNIGIIFAFWAFCVFMTLFGLERTLKPPKGGGTVNIYKKGGAPESVERLLTWKPSDEEAQRETVTYSDQKETSRTEPNMHRMKKTGGILTWTGVRYAIHAEGKQKVLLTDVMGYVKPGRMTALIGGINFDFCN